LADARRIKTLSKLLFKLETRSRSGSNRKIIILIFSYLLPGLFLPYVIFKQSVDPTGYEYAFLTYLFFTVILSFTFISELDNLVISKTETDVFSTLPVEDEIIVSAKIYVIIRYLLILSLPLFIPGSILYYFIVRSVPRILLYYFSGLILAQFIVNVILLVYCIALMNFRLRRLSTYTYIFQVLMIFFLVVGYQFVTYSFTGGKGTSSVSYFEVMLNNGTLQYFPQAWYSFIPVSQNVSVDYKMLVKSILPIFLTYFSFLSLKLYLTENYGELRERFSYSGIFTNGKAQADKRFYLTGIWNTFIENIYIKNKIEQSSFTLLKSFFRRDKAVKLNLLPMIMIPLGLAIFAMLTNQLPPPFGAFFLESKPAFHISIMLAVFMVINTSLLGIKITGNPEASWVYDSYPIESKKRFKNGIRKFFVLYLLIPVCLVLFVIFSFTMPLLQAAVHTLFIFSVSNLFGSIVHSFSKTLPFTKENSIINSVQRISSMFLAIIFGIPFVVLQVLVYRSLFDALAASAAVITAAYWLNYFLFVRDK
jgi:hypothetical protein